MLINPWRQFWLIGPRFLLNSGAAGNSSQNLVLGKRLSMKQTKQPGCGPRMSLSGNGADPRRKRNYFLSFNTSLSLYIYMCVWSNCAYICMYKCINALFAHHLWRSGCGTLCRDLVCIPFPDTRTACTPCRWKRKIDLILLKILLSYARWNLLKPPLGSWI